MKHFKITKGENVTHDARPSPEISGPVHAPSCAILGTDFPGLRPRFEVNRGDRVDAGQVVFRDRKHPDIAFVSPVSGHVTSLDQGPRRTLSAVIVEAEETGSMAEPSETPDLGSVRQALLARGHWPAFRTRPFGRVPQPDAHPAAIVVNAVHAIPGSPDPTVVLAAQRDVFSLGLHCLSKLTEGQVFVCQSPGAPLVPEGDGITCVAFSGTLAAGFASTQVDRVCPATPENEAWTIGYQDVAAIGHLFRTGEYTAERVISVPAASTGQPKLMRSVLGVRLADITDKATGVTLSGGALTGRRAAFLSRFHDQITQGPEDRRHQVNAPWLARIGGRTYALVPNRRLEHALAVDIPTVPLLRALAIGDTAEAARLGCLSLVEEDMIALARRCTSRADYPRLLRRVLDELERDVA